MTTEQAKTETRDNMDGLTVLESGMVTMRRGSMVFEVYAEKGQWVDFNGEVQGHPDWYTAEMLDCGGEIED